MRPGIVVSQRCSGIVLLYLDGSAALDGVRRSCAFVRGRKIEHAER